MRRLDRELTDEEVLEVWESTTAGVADGTLPTFAAARLKAIARFWTAVDVPTQEGCWPWTDCVHNRGYGTFGGGRLGSTFAHRIAYLLLVGPIPAGLVLDHLCRNKLCVNPAHLEPVTIGENVLRGETHTARNRAKTECPKGHPYDYENTYRDKHGWRYCRTCKGLRRTSECSSAASAASRGSGAAGVAGRPSEDAA